MWDALQQLQHEKTDAYCFNSGLVTVSTNDVPLLIMNPTNATLVLTGFYFSGYLNVSETMEVRLKLNPTVSGSPTDVVPARRNLRRRLWANKYTGTMQIFNTGVTVSGGESIFTWYMGATANSPLILKEFFYFPMLIDANKKVTLSAIRTGAGDVNFSAGVLFDILR